MDSRTVDYFVQACGGQLLKGDPEKRLLRVCTDSRQVRPDDLFVALAGEKFDGHDFVQETAKVAAAVMVQRAELADRIDRPCSVILVKDTRKALGQMAARYRKDFELPIIAVGGSNGKTTTKELVASVLRQKFETLWSEASFNNDIGVPMTLLRLGGTHQAAVLEAGTNHPGELAPLVELIAPRFGVITNLGHEHLEFFGDLQGVVREEGTLAEKLPSSGKLFVNGDSEFADTVVRRTSAPSVKVGVQEGNDWRVRNCRLDRRGVTFQVEAPAAAWSGEYRVNLVGRHQATNSLFAIAVGAELGLDRAQVEAGLADCKPSKMRMELWDWNGVRILDDAYNANVDSMTAALQTMKDLPCRGRRVAVLGEMAELGAQSESAHEEVGRRAAELGIGQLFAIGKMASFVARGARAAGLNRVLEFAELEAAAIAVKQFVKEGDVLLLKGSRAARLERVAEVLRSGPKTNGCSHSGGK